MPGMTPFESDRRAGMRRAGAVAAALLSVAVGSLVLADSQSAPEAAAESVPRVSVDPLRAEGPHVYWRGADAVVLWASGNDLSVQEHANATELTIESPFDPGYSVTVSVDPPQREPSVVENVDRIFALGDVHGRFEPMVEVLHSAGVIDDERRWAFGSGHVVFCGDLFDRGARVTEALWLIHQLEREAKASGGGVHLLIGNHEAMVLHGDLRYVHPDLMRSAGVMLMPYDDLFGPDMEFGRWLRTKHTVVRLNDIAFVHGGIGPKLLGALQRSNLSPGRLNALMRDHLDDRAYARRFDPAVTLLLGSAGPLWYRGYFYDDEKYDPATASDVTAALIWLGASRMVVGHTEHEEIVARYDGRVIGVDLDLTENASGLLIEGEAWTVVHGDGRRVPFTAVSAP